MRDDDLDPGANTQMFQAFVDRQEPEASGSRRTPAVLVGVVLAALVIVLALAWLVMGR